MSADFMREVQLARRCPSCGGVRSILLSGESKRGPDGVRVRRQTARVRPCDLSICPDTPGPTIRGPWATDGRFPAADAATPS